MTLSSVPPPDVLLPAYPTLLPGIHVLERDGDEIQFGLDPRYGIIANGLPAAIVDSVRRLDGRRALEDVLLAVGEHRDQFRLLLKQLAALGLVTEAAKKNMKRVETGLWSLRARHYQPALTDRRWQSLIAVHGSGRIAVAVAALLATSGVGHLDIRASGTVTEADLGSGFTAAELGQPRQRAIRNVVARVAPDVTTARNQRRLPDLVLLTDTLVPPRKKWLSWSTRPPRTCRSGCARARASSGRSWCLAATPASAAAICIGPTRICRGQGSRRSW